MTWLFAAGAAIGLVVRAHARARLRALDGLPLHSPPLTPGWWRAWSRAPALFSTWSPTHDEALGALIAQKDLAAAGPIILRLRFQLTLYDGFRGDLAAALSGLRTPAALRALTRALDDIASRDKAAEALVAYGADAVAPLCRALDTYAGKPAAKALGRIGDPRAVGPLRERAFAKTERHGDAEVRSAAIEALGVLGEPGVDALIAGLWAQDQDLRRQCADALGRAGASRAAAPLKALLADADWWLRASALTGLRLLLGRQAAPELKTALADPHEYVREQAIEGLAANADPAVAPAIAVLLRDPQWKVRVAAAKGLDALGARSRGEEQALRLVALGEIAQAALLGRRGVSALVEALAHPLLDKQLEASRLLEKELEHRAADADEAVLRRLAELPPLRGTVYTRVYNGPCDIDGHEAPVISEADPAHLRQLARQELKRREKKGRK